MTSALSADTSQYIDWLSGKSKGVSAAKSLSSLSVVRIDMHNIRYALLLADGRLVFEDGTSPQNAIKRYCRAFPKAPSVLGAEPMNLNKWFGY